MVDNGGEIDFNDVLDEILKHEEQQHKRGYSDGFKDGSIAGSPEGFHLGYHRGAEIGAELGYYLGTVLHHKSEHIKVSYPEKIFQQLCKVEDSIRLFPRTNSPDHEILSLLDAIRAQYRKACALLKISSSHPYDQAVSF